MMMDKFLGTVSVISFNHLVDESNARWLAPRYGLLH